MQAITWQQLSLQTGEGIVLLSATTRHLLVKKLRLYIREILFLVEQILSDVMPEMTTFRLELTKLEPYVMMPVTRSRSV